jgi:hypothetical protein
LGRGDGNFPGLKQIPLKLIPSQGWKPFPFSEAMKPYEKLVPAGGNVWWEAETVFGGDEDLPRPAVCGVAAGCGGAILVPNFPAAFVHKAHVEPVMLSGRGKGPPHNFYFPYPSRDPLARPYLYALEGYAFPKPRYRGDIFCNWDVRRWSMDGTDEEPGVK